MNTKAAPTRRAIVNVIAAGLVLGGGYMVYDGYQNPTYKPAPMPRHEFEVVDPTTEPSASVKPVMEPSTVVIPALGVHAGLTNERSSGGLMTLPYDLTKVGLHTQTAPLAATEGSTVLAGHVNSNGVNGALYRLFEGEPGMVAWTMDADGATRQWVMASLKAYRKVALPQTIFRLDGPRELTVVTCGGGVVTGPYGSHYTDNLVATFVPVPAA